MEWLMQCISNYINSMSDVMLSAPCSLSGRFLCGGGSMRTNFVVDAFPKEIFVCSKPVTDETGFAFFFAGCWNTESIGARFLANPLADGRGTANALDIFCKLVVSDLWGIGELSSLTWRMFFCHSWFSCWSRSFLSLELQSSSFSLKFSSVRDLTISAERESSFCVSSSRSSSSRYASLRASLFSFNFEILVLASARFDWHSPSFLGY